MKRLTQIVFVLLLCVAGHPFGEASNREDRIAVLKFGIESEVLDLIRALRQEKNVEYRDLLGTAYDNARNDELKEALLSYFLDLKDNTLEDRALVELGSADKKGNSLLLNCVSYLTELKSQKASPVFSTLTTGKNKVLALAAIRGLGKLNAVDKLDDLIKLYKDAETDPNFKPDMIWALGEMKAGSAVDLLLSEYDDNESQPLLRRSILEALGKIGDSRAWDRVSSALADPNTDLRAAAVATVSSYPGQGDPVAILTSALRDGQPGVRLAGAQASKVLKNGGLRDLLVYRAKKDPDAKVRVEALRAISAYDDGPAQVLAFLGDRKTDLSLWRESLSLALDQHYPGTSEVLRKVLEEDSKDKLSSLSTVIAGALLPQKETFRELFGILLANEKVAARSTALRAVSLGKFTEYESLLRSLEAKDPDAGVKLQAKNILKEWFPPATAASTK